MHITKNQLRQIIKEELAGVLREEGESSEKGSTIDDFLKGEKYKKGQAAATSHFAAKKSKTNKAFADAREKFKPQDSEGSKMSDLVKEDAPEKVAGMSAADRNALLAKLTDDRSQAQADMVLHNHGKKTSTGKGGREAMNRAAALTRKIDKHKKSFPDD